MSRSGSARRLAREVLAINREEKILDGIAERTELMPVEQQRWWHEMEAFWQAAATWSTTRR